MALADGGRRVRVTFHSWNDAPWSFDQAAEGSNREHPVTQFRRLTAEATDRVDRALVAIHGEPAESSEPVFPVSIQRPDHDPIPTGLRAQLAGMKWAAGNLPDGWSIEINRRSWRLFGMVEGSAVLTLPLAQRRHDGRFLTRASARRKLTAWIWDEVADERRARASDPGDRS